MNTLTKTALFALGLLDANAKERPHFTPVVASVEPRQDIPATLDESISESRNVGSHPVVGACQSQCLFQNDNDRWCFEFTPPILSGGWSWKQEASSSYYKIMIKPYL